MSKGDGLRITVVFTWFGEREQARNQDTPIEEVVRHFGIAKMARKIIAQVEFAESMKRGELSVGREVLISKWEVELLRLNKQNRRKQLRQKVSQ